MKYTVDLSSYNRYTIEEMKEWCKGNLYHGGYYEPDWDYADLRFIFKNEQEYIWFKLRWL